MVPARCSAWIFVLPYCDKLLPEQIHLLSPARQYKPNVTLCLRTLHLLETLLFACTCLHSFSKKLLQQQPYASGAASQSIIAWAQSISSWASAASSGGILPVAKLGTNGFDEGLERIDRCHIVVDIDVVERVEYRVQLGIQAVCNAFLDVQLNNLTGQIRHRPGQVRSRFLTRPDSRLSTNLRED